MYPMRISAICLLGSLLAIGATPAHAVFRTWDPVGLSFDWHTAANWDPAGVPTTDDQVHVPGGLVLLSADTAPVNLLTMNGGAALQTNGHSLNIDLGDLGLLIVDGGGTTLPSVNVFPKIGGGNALQVDQVFLLDGGRLSLLNDGVAALVESGMTIEPGGRLTTSGPGAKSLTFSANASSVLRNDGMISVDGGTFTVTRSPAHTSTFDLDGSNDAGVIEVTSGELRTEAPLTDAFDGTATVSGADAAWMHLFDLFLGGEGMGTVTVSDGGSVLNTNGRIGSNPSASGTVTVTGAGSNWSGSSSLVVGDNGEGTLTVSEGGTVLNGVAVIGGVAGSSGTVTVSGADSAWTNSNFLHVGDSGDGTLSIEAGAASPTPAGRSA